MWPGTETRSGLGRVFGAARRREREAEEFIALLRQASALLQAGRGIGQLWAELAGLYSPCADPDRGARTSRGLDSPPHCCLHHVLRHADVAQRLVEPPFRGVTGPGRAESWEQLQACLDLAARAGVAVADLLARMADALEDGQDAHQARESATAGPRSTARLLMGMPLAGMGLSLVAGAPVTELLSAPLGWIVLSAGAAFTVTGQLWTRALIRTAEQDS